MRISKTPKLNLAWLDTLPKKIDIGDGIDYYKLFYVLKLKIDSCYLFESLALPRHQDRYYTLGFDPVIEFAAKGNKITISGKPEMLSKVFGRTQVGSVEIECDNPYEFLKANVPLHFYGSCHMGGLIGYYTYESINYFEPALQLPEHPDFDTFKVGLYTDGLIYDSLTGMMQYYTYGEDRSELVMKLVDASSYATIPTRLRQVEMLGHSSTKEDHEKAVEYMLDQIRRGNSFQGEVGYKTHYSIKGDKIAVYDKLRQINPSPYMFYLKFDDVELLGASPEILVSMTDGEVLTTPTAGTVKRGANEAEDQALARKLLRDPKELAEHNMLVDLHRNDLSRVCRVDSVKVRDLMYVIKFSHVQHIVSDITGILAKGKTAYDLLAAITPGGVLTGAPKIETMKIINHSEKAPRGPYGGAVGRFSMNGDAVFCLPIRSLFCRGDKCYTQTSSGVVYDSKPEREYDELSHKLAAIEATIKSCAEESYEAVA